MNNKERLKKKVLIVDDDADFVEMNQRVLEQNGYEVTAAYSGQECLQQVQSKRPDIVLLDMMMETWSEGTNVVDKLRSSRATKNIPIILISAVNLRSNFADVSDTEDFLDVDGYMTKPFVPDKLLEKVKEVVEI